jgi:hypothetical protein
MGNFNDVSVKVRNILRSTAAAEAALADSVSMQRLRPRTPSQAAFKR